VLSSLRFHARRARRPSLSVSGRPGSHGSCRSGAGVHCGAVAVCPEQTPGWLTYRDAVAGAVRGWLDHLARQPVWWLLAVNGLALWVWYPTAYTGRADEPAYQRFGAAPLATVVSNDPAWGIPYAIWYYALETIGLTGSHGFMATSVALSLAMSLLIHRYAIALSGSAVAALLTASIYTLSFLNIGCWPKVGLASMVPVLPALAYGVHDGWRWRSRTALTLGALCASYFRPDMGLAALLAAAWMLAGLWGRAGPGLAAAGAVTAGMAALVGGLHATVGLPLVAPSDRPALALTQHFALNWKGWTGYPGNHWLEHARIWEDVFGTTTVGHVAALRANPIMMLRHVADNALRVGIESPSMMFVSGSYQLPLERTSIVQVPALVLLAVLITAARRSWTAMPDRAWLRAQAIPWAILLVPAVIAGVLVYPRHHATAWISVIVLVGLWAVIGRGTADRRRLAAFGVAFILAMTVGVPLLVRE
jgi:hypothetical protein